MDPHDLDGQRAAYRPDFPFYDENERMLSWYAARVEDCVRRIGARAALSLGVGQRVVARRLLALLGAAELVEYVVLDGSPEAIAEFEREAATAESQDASPEAVLTYFETFETDRGFDLIEMGFVLEHVDDPGLVLRRYAKLLKPDGRLIVAVPNARSLHRLVGLEAGLLEDLYALSEADLRLGHQRYFDLARLRRLVAECGLASLREEGIFLKPVTTGQLKSLQLSDPVLDAFCRVAVDLPDISNALFMECGHPETRSPSRSRRA